MIINCTAVNICKPNDENNKSESVSCCMESIQYLND